MKHRDRITIAIGGAVLVSAVLLIGGAFRWTQALVAVLVAAALGVQLLARRRLDRLSPLLALIGVAILLTVVQLIPVPDSVRQTLEPVGEQLRREGAALAGTHPLGTLSLEPAGTLRALGALVILFGVAVLGLRVAANERGRYIILVGTAATCGLAALVTGIHVVVNADSLYGLYSPAHASPPVLGPLLNANHLGSLMAFGSVLSLGLAFYVRQSTQLRVAWIVNGLGCGVVTFATQSRGAILALVIGIGVAATLGIAQKMSVGKSGRRRKTSILTNELPIAVFVAFALGLAVFATASKIADQLENTTIAELDQPVSKYAAWKSSLQLVRESPILGIGRGATEPALTRVNEASSFVTFSHLENEYVQVIVEWGVAGTLLIAIAFGWCLFVAAKTWRDGGLRAAALGALAAVLFQSAVDFGVELIGLAIPVTLVATTVLSVPLRNPTQVARVLTSRILLIGALVATAAMLMQPWARSLQEDHDALDRTSTPTLADLRPMIERHPLDYVGFAAAASTLASSDTGRAVDFLNHALTLHPTHTGMHRLAGRMLAAANRKPQAAIELSLALRGAAQPTKVLAEIVDILPNADDAALAIPADYRDQDIVMHALSDLKRDDVSLKWLLHVISLPQNTPDVIDRLYNLAYLKNDAAAAETAARARLKVTSTSTSKLMLARVLVKRQQLDEAAKLVADSPTWHGRIDEKLEAWGISCDVMIANRDWDNALECVHRLDGSGLLGMERRRTAITGRIETITRGREWDQRQRVIDELELKLHSGSAASAPKAAGSASPAAKP